MVPVGKGSWTKWKGISRKNIEERECISVVPSCMCNVAILSLHYFIKQQQVNAYEDHKMKVQNDSELAVLQIDFVENFSTLWQDEVQSAH